MESVWECADPCMLEVFRLARHLSEMLADLTTHS